MPVPSISPAPIISRSFNGSTRTINLQLAVSQRSDARLISFQNVLRLHLTEDFTGLAVLGRNYLGAEADRGRPPAGGNDLLEPIEGAAAHEQDVSRVDLQEFLLRMLASALRRHRRDGAFHDLEQGLLYALARDVAGDRGVVGLAADLVDLVDIDDAALGALDVVVGGLQQLEDESRRATSPTRTCSLLVDDVHA